MAAAAVVPPESGESMGSQETRTPPSRLAESLVETARPATRGQKTLWLATRSLIVRRAELPA
jgi:hypothetical protein